MTGSNSIIVKDIIKIDLKKTYISPKIEINVVELEQGIAVGSVTNDAEVNNTVQQEWENGEDDNRVFSW